MVNIWLKKMVIRIDEYSFIMVVRMMIHGDSWWPMVMEISSANQTLSKFHICRWCSDQNLHIFGDFLAIHVWGHQKVTIKDLDLTVEPGHWTIRDLTGHVDIILIGALS